MQYPLVLCDTDRPNRARLYTVMRSAASAIRGSACCMSRCSAWGCECPKVVCLTQGGNTQPREAESRAKAQGGKAWGQHNRSNRQHTCVYYGPPAWVMPLLVERGPHRMQHDSRRLNTACLAAHNPSRQGPAAVSWQLTGPVRRDRSGRLSCTRAHMQDGKIHRAGRNFR